MDFKLLKGLKFMFDKEAFQKICLVHFELLIRKKPYAKSFEIWEKNNLTKLLKTTSSYKRSANPKSKANTLQRFNDEEKKNELISEFLKLHGAPSRLQDITDQEVIAIFLDSYKTGECEIGADIGLFIHLKILQPAITNEILERLSAQEELTQKEPVIDLTNYLHKDEAVNVNKIAEYIKQSSISNMQVFEKDISEIVGYFIALTRNYPKVLGSISGIEEIASSQSQKVNELIESVTNVIPKEKTEYRVVVNGMKEMGTFHIANVAAVETLSGQLVPINQGLAEELFPTRGSIFFPKNSLSNFPNEDLSFGCYVESSDREGSNKFRFKCLWEDIHSVIECENGLENIEQLVSELKSFDLSAMPNDFWFMLPDGSLIKPKTKRLLILSSSLQEPWWYVANTSINIFVREQGFVSKAELNNKSIISMQSNEELFKSLKEAENRSTAESIPVELFNRKPYLESYIHKSGTNAEEVINSLFEIFTNSPTLENLLKREKILFLETIDEDIKKAREFKEKLEEEIERINNKKLKLNSNIEEIEGNISSRINTAIKKSKNDLITIFDEPLAQLFISSIGSNADSKPLKTGSNTDTILPLVETLNFLNLRTTFKLNGIKLETSYIQEKLFSALLLLLSQRNHVAFTGRLNSVFISSFLSYAGHSQYYFSKLLLADEVSETSRVMLTKRTFPLVIHPTSKVEIEIFQHELMISSELEGFAECPVLFCCDKTASPSENIIYFDCDKLSSLTDDGVDLETYVDEVGNEESSKKIKTLLRKTNNQIREWHLYSLIK